MKKSLFSYLLLFFVFPASFAHAASLPVTERFYQDGVWVSRPDRSRGVIEHFLTSAQINTVDQYMNWLSLNIRYAGDGQLDRWAPAEETLFKKQGDCEDMALLNKTVLTSLGLQTGILVLHIGQKAHAICYFIQNGRYYWIDNTILHKTYAQNETQFLLKLLQSYPTTRIIAVKDSEKKIIFQA